MPGVRLRRPVARFLSHLWLCLFLAASTAAVVPQVSSAQSAGTSKARKKAVKKVPTRPATPPLPDPVGASGLASRLATIVSRFPPGETSVFVLSLARGDTLFSHRGRVPVVPASTMKLLTAALALDRLGPAARLSTDLLTDGVMEPGGVLRGSLYLRGSGDPSMSARFWGGDPAGAMKSLARELRSQGVVTVTGSLFGDESAFDDPPIPEGWLSRYAGASYAAPISALSLNENMVTVGVSGSGAYMRPVSAALRVNSTIVPTTSRTSSFSASMSADGNIYAWGKAGTRASSRSFGFTVPDPSKFTTGALYAALLAEGITVQGSVYLGRTPAKATRLASAVSLPMSAMVSFMNAHSVNHFAELLLRASSRPNDGSAPGSIRLASAQLKSLFARIGADSSALAVYDGSGLSVKDRITARDMAILLSYAIRAPWASDFVSSLPVAGLTATLKNRMRATAAVGRIRAKTGTTSDVVALSGFATSASGEPLAFAIFYNGPSRLRARPLLDQVAVSLALFRR